MIKVTVFRGHAEAVLQSVAAVVTQPQYVLQRAAARVLREVVERTPKRWFGQVRRSWQIVTKDDQTVAVQNPHKVMGYLEFGTANEGTGFIYPKRAKALYIPLNRRASFKWTPELEEDVDYVVRKRVRGIRPRRIAQGMRQFAEDALIDEMRKAIRRRIKAVL